MGMSAKLNLQFWLGYCVPAIGNLAAATQLSDVVVATEPAISGTQGICNFGYAPIGRLSGCWTCNFFGHPANLQFRDPSESQKMQWILQIYQLLFQQLRLDLSAEVVKACANYLIFVESIPIQAPERKYYFFLFWFSIGSSTSHLCECTPSPNLIINKI